MRISLQWLKDYVDVSDSPEALAHRLTMAGLEVGSIERLGDGIDDVVTAQILERGRHPDADRLSLCRVTDGTETFDIVCGATNMMSGDKVALARVGSKLPGGVEIRKAKIRGQVSYGMMCSEREMGLSESHEGILILPPDVPLGKRLVDVLGLPDAVLEVELTPNRPDCLSVVGVAREVSALSGAPLRPPAPRVPEAGAPVGGQTSIEILAPELCHRYAARLIRGVRVGPSPEWMKRRLQAAGVRAISNVVDVTNYVLLELGHPLHAFDFGKLRGGRIVVKRARDGEAFTTLDGQERVLDGDSMVICDGEGPVALAGIMGGLNSEVSDDTVDVLLESAWFLPTNIRRTSKKLGLRSEASYRFERGTDVEGLITALDRATELIIEVAGGMAARGVWDAYPTRHAPREVLFRPERASAVLGISVTEGEASNHLGALGMTVRGTGEGTLKVEIPTHRVDLEREIDLIEEVARIRGYDGIPTTLPRIPMVAEAQPARLKVADAARNLLAGAGLREVITLSFIDPQEDDRLGLPEGHPLRPKVVLQNPLSVETEVLRASLLPGLLQVTGTNARRQMRDCRFFEVGRTFHPAAGADLPTEILRASAVLAGRRDPVAWWASGDAVDYFDAKGVAEALLAGLGVRAPAFEKTAAHSWLHPGRAADIRVQDRVVGWVGEVHPERLDPYGVAGPVCALELDLDAVCELAAGVGTFGGLARFPAVERDLAIVVDRGVASQTVVDAIHSLRSPLVQSVALFDAFEGGRIPQGMISMAFRVTYRSSERTLTEDEVTEVEGCILGHLAQSVGAKLRDV